MRGYHIMPWQGFETAPSGLPDERFTTTLPRDEIVEIKGFLVLTGQYYEVIFYSLIS